ncbi:MAG: hypothetical protein DRP84_05300 [Spirochaetes bacterium]|nr:MAG: hypothetical protein DRP84_05300 [Spirochaetota bacterium]
MDESEIQNERDLGKQKLGIIKQKPPEFQNQKKYICENEMERYRGEKSLIDETFLFVIKKVNILKQKNRLIGTKI